MRGSSKYTVEVLHSSDPLQEWNQFVDESPQGCVFCRSWWLEAVCPGRFEILTLRRGRTIVAGMPLPVSRKRGQRIAQMPRLTQTLGVLLRPSSRETYEGRLSYEMEVLENLIEAMPKLDRLSIRFHYSFTNWLPFYWAGYQQTTRYTYTLADLTDLEQVFSGFAHSKRKNIKKAEKLVRVHQGMAVEDFYAHHAMTRHKQGDSLSYSYELFSRLYDAAHKHQAGRTWYAVDSQQNIHAAIFVVFDSKSAYYLISSIDPEHRRSGAATLLVRDAIAYTSRYTKRFDFEGSMIRGVEHSFRKFGAVQTPYFSISKDSRPFCLQVGLAGYHRITNMFRSAATQE
jgi:hypothetical protein